MRWAFTVVISWMSFVACKRNEGNESVVKSLDDASCKATVVLEDYQPESKAE